jgi:hypothetical protein
MTDITGATATLSSAAGVGTFTVGAATMALDGVTATVFWSANPAAFTPASALTLAGVTAMVTLDASIPAYVVGDYLIGDSWASPNILSYSGVSNTQTFQPNLAAATAETWEAYTKTLWWLLTTTSPMAITASTTAGTITWFDESLNEITLASPFILPAGASFYLQLGSSDPSPQPTLTIVAEAVTIPASLTVGDINRTPGALSVSGGNFPPNATITFTIPGTALSTTFASNSDGTVTPRTVYVDISMTAGQYVANATSGAYVGTDTFTVVNSSLPAASTPSDAAPTIPVGSGVVKWLLRDPYLGGSQLADYTFPINPKEMSSPHAPVNLLVDRTVAEAGQVHVWEGGLAAHEWTFTGYLETQAFHDALKNYKAIGRRFHLRDHRNRIWTVTFTDVKYVPVRNNDKPWAHTYTVSALIYGGPVAAT